MQLTIEDAPAWKWFTIHIGVFCLGYILYAAAYGAIAGAFLAVPVTANAGSLTTIPEESVIAGQIIEQAGTVNWWIILPTMNFAVFALLGGITGLFGFVKYVCVVPIALFILSIPMMTSPIHSSVNLYWLVGASVVSQFLAAYLSAFGTKVLRKRGASKS